MARHPQRLGVLHDWTSSTTRRPWRRGWVYGHLVIDGSVITIPNWNKLALTLVAEPLHPQRMSSHEHQESQAAFFKGWEYLLFSLSLLTAPCQKQVAFTSPPRDTDVQHVGLLPLPFNSIQFNSTNHIAPHQSHPMSKNLMYRCLL